MSYRRLWILVWNLPPESVTHTALRDGMTDEQIALASKGSTTHGRWSKSDYMLAEVIDLLALQIWQAGGAQGEQPKPKPRPGISTKKATRGTPQGRALIAAIRDNGGGVPVEWLAETSDR